MRWLSVALLAFSAFTLSCGTTDYCDETENDCWAESFQLQLDGQEIALQAFESTRLGPGTGGEAVPISDSSVVWTVGSGAKILELTGDKRRTFDAPAPLEAVWGSSFTDAWAAGGQKRMHFDGQSWTAVSDSPVALHAVWGTASNDVFFAGDEGTVLHWNGSGTLVVHQAPGVTLRAISGTSATDVWVGGDNSELYRFNGAAFTKVSGTFGDIRALWAQDATHLFIGSTVALRRWNAGSLEPLGLTQVHGLFGKNGVLYAVDPSTVTAYDMTTLSRSAEGAVSGPRAVWSDGVTHWVTGWDGAVFAGASLQNLTGQNAPELGELKSVYGVPAPSTGGGSTATELLPPRILNQPAPITVDTTTSEFAEFELEWEDPNGCRPAMCFYTCPSGTAARCDGVWRCAPGSRDTKIRAFNRWALRPKKQPLTEKPPQRQCQVTPVVFPECLSFDEGMKQGKTPLVGRTISFGCTFTGAPDEPSGSGGGSGGTCAHCVDGQPCGACGGGISCKNACCGSGETCTANGCRNAAGNGGMLGVSVYQCGVGRYTVPCNSNGGCCPTCTRCGAVENTCDLP